MFADLFNHKLRVIDSKRSLLIITRRFERLLSYLAVENRNVSIAHETEGKICLHSDKIWNESRRESWKNFISKIRF